MSFGFKPGGDMPGTGKVAFTSNGTVVSGSYYSSKNFAAGRGNESALLAAGPVGKAIVLLNRMLEKRTYVFDAERGKFRFALDEKKGEKEVRFYKTAAILTGIATAAFFVGMMTSMATGLEFVASGFVTAYYGFRYDDKKKELAEMKGMLANSKPEELMETLLAASFAWKTAGTGHKTELVRLLGMDGGYFTKTERDMIMWARGEMPLDVGEVYGQALAAV